MKDRDTMTETNDPQLPPCPECESEFTYETGALLTCPMCGHEWAPASSTDEEATAGDGETVIRDAVGNVLNDGDDVSLAKSVKIAGGGGGTIKAGTKVRGIRLTEDRGDGHDIDARIPGVGRLQLKSSVVKKIS